MDELQALHTLARVLGVAVRYEDGLGRPVEVAPETLVRVCAAQGAEIAAPADAEAALRAWRASEGARLVPHVLVAWDGWLPTRSIIGHGEVEATLELEDGTVMPVQAAGGLLRCESPLPLGYHTLTVEAEGHRESCRVISAPEQAYRRPDAPRSWGVGAQLAALRSRRSRAVGDLRDLESLCTYIGERGGDVVTVLPLLPTFNTQWPEPNPYSPVSRLFWSELVIDLGEAHVPAPPPPPITLDVTAADAEVRAALAGRTIEDPSGLGAELRRYARFRGAQAKHGRNWRDWPAAARAGQLAPHDAEPTEEQFHLVAQVEAHRQLRDLRARLDGRGFRLGLDLAVGTHPDGYDPWSRQDVFGNGMSVGAPPDKGFPSGQDWGFSPVLPEPSRRTGHEYVIASIAHQMELAGLLRIDHVMAWTRLYWIPHGFGLHDGTYVSYPAEELFAILTLESVRHRCEVVGENLGTVPPEIDAALPRHRIWGMYLAQFQAVEHGELVPPTDGDMALIGTHDTPTFAGWLAGADIDERVRHGLLAPAEAPRVAEARSDAVQAFAELLGGSVDHPGDLLKKVLDWLGRSESPLVVPWLEDLWLEVAGRNLPGTRSSERLNWQEPMARLLDDVLADPQVDALLRHLQAARTARGDGQPPA